jgi:peptidoglycan/LPS O-acetylase OafA/YrhL
MISFKKLLQRSTQSTSFIPEIDGLRFFAIITVVFFHLNTAYSRQIGMDDLAVGVMGGKANIWAPAWWIIRLDLGVKVFFAISGFVLALPFLKQYLQQGKKVAIGDYFYRRLTRLEPPFVVTLLFFTVVHVVVFGKTMQELQPHFWAGLIYSHVLIFGAPSPINPVTWSLETEAQFYILVPAFFALLFAIRNVYIRYVLLMVLFLASIGFRSLTFNVHPHVSSSILAYFSNFLMGILFAWYYLQNRLFFTSKHFGWDVLGIGSVFLLFFVYKPQNDFLLNSWFNIAILGFFVAAFKGRMFNRFFSWTPVYLIGGMCYTIYLLHYAFFHLIIKFTGNWSLGMGYFADLLLQVLVVVPVILALSVLFFVLIEKPCMDKNWPQKLYAFLTGKLKSNNA